MQCILQFAPLNCTYLTSLNSQINFYKILNATNTYQLLILSHQITSLQKEKVRVNKISYEKHVCFWILFI